MTTALFSKYLTLAFEGFLAAEVSIATHPAETKTQAILAAVGAVAKAEEGDTNPIIAQIAAITSSTLSVLYATGQIHNPNPTATPNQPVNAPTPATSGYMTVVG